MAVTRNARDLMYYDLVVTRRARLAPYPDLSELTTLWKKAYSDPNFPVRTFQDGSITALIKDIYEDPQKEIITLLIEFSDREAPDAAYANHRSRTTRTHIKGTDEGSGHAAHIFVSTKPQRGIPQTYMALIEAIPSVPTQRIQALLNSIIKHYCQLDKTLFTYTKPTGTKKPIDYLPHIALGGHPSTQFINDIEQGRINSMTLVSPKVKEPLGKSPYLKLEQLTMKVKVVKTIPPGHRWKTLWQEANLNKGEFPQARISVQPEKDGKSFSVDIDATTGNLIGDAYVKVKRIDNITPPMSTSSPDKVVSQLYDRASAIIVTERKN